MRQGWSLPIPIIISRDQACKGDCCSSAIAVRVDSNAKRDKGVADLQPLTGGHIVSWLDDRFFAQHDGKEGVTGVIGDAIIGIDIGEGTEIGKRLGANIEPQLLLQLAHQSRLQ